MISVHIENFYGWFPDAKELLSEHAKEMEAKSPEFHWQPDLDWYRETARRNALIVIVARDNSKPLGKENLAGYHISYIGTNAHALGTLFAFEEAFYVKPEYRGQGLAPRLVQESERQWVKRGASVGCRYTSGAGGFYRAMGYRPAEQLMIKKLEG